MERSRTTSTRRTSCQSQRAGARGSGALSSRKTVPARARTSGSGFSSRLFILSGRFVNQHHRNVVAHGVDALALAALQPAAVRLQLDLRLARGARQYFQQVLTDRHTLNLFNLRPRRPLYTKGSKI